MNEAMQSVSDAVQVWHVNLGRDAARFSTITIMIGVLTVLLGLLCVAKARQTTKFTIQFVGWLLLLAAGLLAAVAIVLPVWVGFFGLLVCALLPGVVGLQFVTRPTMSAEVVTAIMATFYLIAGLLQCIVPFWLMHTGWQLAALNGVIDIILAIIVFRAMPAAGLYLIGLLIGINMIFNGIYLTGLGMMLR
ncbi:MAG TPA: DUF308 domain-containing protein [Verrucomicrobiae bacterium]|nr:DUF308 domain-containing protein [Verrucomicrobiae bacterium]